MVWSRERQTNLLRPTLREFYPAALVAFDDLASGDALEVLKVAPTPTLGAGLSLSKIAAALRRDGRQRRIDARALEIQAALRTPQLQASAAVATAMGVSVSSLVAVIATMGAQIDQLAGSCKRVLSSTRTPWWSVPCQDWGPSSAPGCSASSGMTRTATPPPSHAKTIPARRPSPAPRAPNASCWPASPATSASPTPSYRWAFATLTASPGARDFYDTHRAAGDTHRAAGDTHHAALRALGNRLVGILHGCLQHHILYDETIAWGHRAEKNLPEAA